jgi:hypothetical protein
MFNVISLLLLGLFLAIMVMLASIWITRSPQAGFDARRWLVFLLAVNIGLAILLGIFLTIDLMGGLSLQLTALITVSTLVMVLVILLLRWRDFVSLWPTERGLLTGIGITLIILIVIFLIGDPGFLPAVLLVSVIGALIWALGQRANSKVWIIVNLIITSWMLLHGRGDWLTPLSNTSDWLVITYASLTQLAIFTAPLLAAIPFYTSFRAAGKINWRSAAIPFATSILLLAALTYVVFQESLRASSQTRVIEDNYPFIEMLTATLAGMLMVSSLDRPRQVIGPIYALMVCMLMALAFSRGWQMPNATLLPEHNLLQTLFILIGI